MRAKWLQMSVLITSALLLPGQLMAHPGHPGYGLPDAPATGEDYLTAGVIIVGLVGIRAIWRAISRRSN